MCLYDVFSRRMNVRRSCGLFGVNGEELLYRAVQLPQMNGSVALDNQFFLSLGRENAGGKPIHATSVALFLSFGLAAHSAA